MKYELAHTSDEMSSETEGHIGFTTLGGFALYAAPKKNRLPATTLKTASEIKREAAFNRLVKIFLISVFFALLGGSLIGLFSERFAWIGVLVGCAVGMLIGIGVELTVKNANSMAGKTVTASESMFHGMKQEHVLLSMFYGDLASYTLAERLHVLACDILVAALCCVMITFRSNYLDCSCVEAALYDEGNTNLTCGQFENCFGQEFVAQSCMGMTPDKCEYESLWNRYVSCHWEAWDIDSLFTYESIEKSIFSSIKTNIVKQPVNIFLGKYMLQFVLEHAEVGCWISAQKVARVWASVLSVGLVIQIVFIAVCDVTSLTPLIGYLSFVLLFDWFLAEPVIILVKWRVKDKCCGEDDPKTEATPMRTL